MSEVMIRGMEMPKACWECPLKVHLFQQLWCTPSNKVIDRGDNTEREPDCPLVEVQPHGRLIDADAFDERVRVAGGMSEEELTEDFKDGVQTVLYMLSKQPPIIEAEVSEDENNNV